MVSQFKTQAAGEQDAFLELPRKMSRGGRSAPRIDAFEAEGMIEMIAEVPGVPESAIDVSLDGDILTIEVDKGDDKEGKRALFTERVMGRFRRSIQMPFAPDPAKVEAALQDGLLTIRFPRVEQPRMHRIAVRGAQPQAKGQGSAIGSTWAESSGTPAEPLTLDVKATPAPPGRAR
ncbi:MAG: Hsp20/alpha crystallin family protein [Pseudomonadota bacterium]|nr:Hsp20/alpha crystallin family protein [Pseudomonadota bacterium]